MILWNSSFSSGISHGIKSVVLLQVVLYYINKELLNMPHSEALFQEAWFQSGIYHFPKTAIFDHI